MAAPRTVLHLIDTGGPGGAETIFLNLATGLDPARWRSVAVVPVKDWLWGALEAEGIKPILLSSSGSFDIRLLTGVNSLAREHRADLIQTHLFTSAVYASVAATPAKLPVVCRFHGSNDMPASESFRAAKFRIVNRRRNRHVFVSGNLRTWFLSNSTLNASRSRV